MSRLTFSQDNDDHADGNDDEDNNDDNNADDDLKGTFLKWRHLTAESCCSWCSLCCLACNLDPGYHMLICMHNVYDMYVDVQEYHRCAVLLATEYH